MFEWIIRMFSWLTQIWNNLPKKQQDKIIDLILEHFEKLLRAYYRLSRD